MRKKSLYAALLTTALFTLPAAASAAYVVQTVADPTGNNFINLLGINNAGTVAGFDNNNPAQGFTLTLPAGFTAENVPGAVSTMVTAINNNGDTAGIFVDAGGNTNGFTKIGGTVKVVNDPVSAVFNQALGINNSRATVGYFAPTQAGNVGQVAYSQAGGVFTNIPNLPSNFNSQAVGINNAGTIVGFYQPTATTFTGFLDTAGVISVIDPLGSANTQALGINNHGEIVGFFVDAADVQHGYVDINGAITVFDPAGSTNTTINGVNDLGQLAGFYTDANGNTIGFVASPVPEPVLSTLVLLAGLAPLRLRRRRS